MFVEKPIIVRKGLTTQNSEHVKVETETKEKVNRVI